MGNLHRPLRKRLEKLSGKDWDKLTIREKRELDKLVGLQELALEDPPPGTMSSPER